MDGTSTRDDASAEGSAREYALVRIGAHFCALPHGAPGPDPGAHPGQFRLRRIMPWHLPTPLPGMPGRLVLGVVPIADAEGIEHVEVVVDLAFALGLSNEGVQRDKKSCILIYENDDIVVGLAVDALVQRVSFAPPAGSIDLPFTTGLILDGDSAPDRHAEWRVIDVDALMRHVARELKVPMHA